MVVGFFYIVWELWPWLKGDLWRGVTLLLALTSVVLCVGWYKTAHEDHGFGPVKILPFDQLEDVHDRTYIDQEVQLDGKSYQHCHFENVSLKYNGTGNFQLTENNFAGRNKLVSDNEAILQAWGIMDGLGITKPTSRALDKNNNPITNIQPLVPDSPTQAKP